MVILGSQKRRKKEFGAVVPCVNELCDRASTVPARCIAETGSRFMGHDEYSMHACRGIIASKSQEGETAISKGGRKWHQLARSV